MKPIKGFPGYKINEKGQVRGPEGPIKSRPDSDGYRRVDLYKNGKRFTRFVHTLVNEAYNGGSGEVDHKNSNRADNSARNLESVSRKENMRRMAKKN